MFNIVEKKLTWGNTPLTLQTGKMARQADGAVVVTYGKTMVLCTVVAQKAPTEGLDFFPLSVHYQEKFYAAGRIPGGFLKREGRPSEYDVLTSRLIDRPLRPLFPKTFKNETQVICTVISHDKENDPAVPAMIGASAALAISGIPFHGPIAGARIGFKEGKYLLNPTATERKESRLDLTVAGTKEGVLMVESEAHELSEKEMLEAVMFGHKAYQEVIQAIESLAAEAGKPAWTLPEADAQEEEVTQKVVAFATAPLKEAYTIREKQQRRERLQAILEETLALFAEDETISPKLVKGAFSRLEKELMRRDLLKTKKRIDGRDLVTVRPISCEVGLLPSTHGSALFTRGETQALVVTTLGTGDDEQIMDVVAGEYREPFMLHYNFPPFSVGEVGRFGSPGRREIGHGKLAWRAIAPLLPEKGTFPYTLRTVSEVTESNGSSSMATVCGTSLSMMDAGVKLKDHIAGIAMGLIKEDDDFVVLSDILGDEDHLGDMDFKVAGTRDGITALQMDIKITSINEAIMTQALAQALDGRLHIIAQMEKAIKGAREELNDNAPRFATIKIHTDKIRDVIGSGGKVIREICEKSGAKVEIEDDGSIKIFGPHRESIDEALKRIDDIVAEPEIGGVYTGRVTKITDFGAFVNFLSTFGLIHVSEIAHERVNNVSDVLKVGDTVTFKVVSSDDKGKLRLSIKALDDKANKEKNVE